PPRCSLCLCRHVGGPGSRYYGRHRRGRRRRWLLSGPDLRLELLEERRGELARGGVDEACAELRELAADFGGGIVVQQGPVLDRLEPDSRALSVNGGFCMV